MDEVLITLEKISTSVSYAWPFQTTNIICKKSTDSLSKMTSEKGRTEEQDKGRDDTEIVGVLMTDKADAMYVENSTAINVRVVDLNNYHRAALFVIIEKVENSNIPLHDVSLSHVTSLRASLRRYDFNYFRAHYLPALVLM